MEWLLHNYILNCYIFSFSIFFWFVHNHCERIDEPIGMKFVMSTWSGYVMVIKKLTYTFVLPCF